MTKLTLCPICEKKPATSEYKPFCSKRCADVDLSRWLSDRYAIPGQETGLPPAHDEPSDKIKDDDAL